MNYMKRNLFFSVFMLVVGIGCLVAGFIIESTGNEANSMFFGLGCGMGAS